MTGRHRSPTGLVTGRHRAPPGRPLLWVPAAVLGVLALAAAAVTWTDGLQAGDDGAAARRSSTPAVTATLASAPPTDRRRRSTEAAIALPGAGVPSRVLIDGLGIDAPVLSVAMQGQSLDPPPDPQELGWWEAGARPGAARGSALIVGHTVHAGDGALDDLEEMVRGTEIRVRTSGGTVRYVADRVVVLDKETVARRAPRLFGQEVDGRLVLVTCEGWDGSGYRSNVVVTAVPVA